MEIPELDLEIDLEIAIYEAIDDEVTENILQLADPKFHQSLLLEITEQIIVMWESHNMLCAHRDTDTDIDDDLFDDIEVVANKMIDRYFETSSLNWNIPKRSHKNSDLVKELSRSDLAQTIEWLRNIPQPVQRTPEWYTFRHGLITASNLAKVFNSEAQRNSLIYEKCQPLIEGGGIGGSGRPNIGTNNPMHWGQKYEPVSIMIYESRYNTQVTDFGCIQHPKYSFIGASPDGINCDPEKARYGRMLEVKNIVNREIDGIPSKAYWIQMQIQMETCDLDECDFLETRFVEYPPLDDNNDNDEEQIHPIYTDDQNGFKGIILYFIERANNGSPHYEYMPLSIPLEIDAVEAWILETRNRLRDRFTLYETKYWYLVEYSCVLVERNRTWFAAALPKIEETWNTILRERETGYEHRAAKKRVPATDKIQQLAGGSKSVCLVKLDYPSE